MTIALRSSALLILSTTTPLLYAANNTPLIVTATRTAQSADETLAPVIVITREEIERAAATDVADLLRFHAGLDLGRNGGPGQLASLFIRGTDSNHTLVMIDGVKINPGTIGGAALQNIDPALIERIEIVKGPRSALYGSDAVGGVVHIFTRRGAQGLRVDAGAGGGTYDTRTAHAAAHYGKEKTRAGVDLSWFETAGFSPRSDSTLDRGHDKLSLNLYAGAQLGPVDAEASHWQATGNTEYLDFFLAPLDQDFENTATRLVLKAAPREDWLSTLALSRATDEIDQNQGADFAHTERLALDWQNDAQISAAQLLTAGIYVAREDTSASVYGTGFDETTDINAVYLQDSFTLDAHRLLLAARYTDHEGFGGHTTWDAEYGYQWTTSTRFTASAGTAFRAPDATDRFGYGGDPNLDPETSRNIEAGVRHAFTPRQSVAVNVFDNRIEDLIEYDFATDKMVNVGRAKIRGVEATYVFDAKPWNLRVEAIAQNPRDDIADEPLARRAKRSASAALNYDGGRYRAGAQMLASGPRKDSAFSDTELGGYGIVNLTGEVDITKEWLLRGRIENLFDKDYKLADGYNTAGQSFFAEVRYALAL